MAAPGDVGFPGLTFAAGTPEPTASKPESKLWFNGGWWAIMLDPASHAQHIFRLDRAAQVWSDTGIAVDGRETTHADVLWDAPSGKLYVASHEYTEYPARPTANGARLWRFSYDAAGSTYRLDNGFPVTLNDAKTETLVIAKDTKGKLWATWVAEQKVWATHSTKSDNTWTTPYALPSTGASGLAIDDISSVIAFGNRIGVMWNNQTDGTFRFAVHNDGAGDKAANWSATTVTGGAPSDDHINLKADAAGRVYAVVKHTVKSPLASPFISLLVRDPGGAWTRTTVATLADSNTRPIVLLDEVSQQIHILDTGPTPPSRIGQHGGTIYDRTSPMGTIAFAPGQGTPVMSSASGAELNDVTSTKQNLDATTGLVALASSTTSYWHADESWIAPPAPPPAPRLAPLPPAAAKPRRPMLNAKVARLRTARMLARLYGRSWTKGKRRSLRCVRRTGRARTHKKVTKKKTFAAVSRTRYRTYDCRISWRARTRRYHARSTVVRRGLRITTRVRVQTIRP